MIGAFTRDAVAGVAALASLREHAVVTEPMGKVRGSPDAGPGWPLVVFCGSAGGIEALRQILPGLPVDLPAPVLVLQHLGAGRTDSLVRLLARWSELPLDEAHDGEPLSTGTIYVAPSGTHLVVDRDEVLFLTHEAPVHHSRPSVDTLLASVARNFGPRAFVVVLSGAGTDGAEGATAVKARGGAVLVQHPDTCVNVGMPSAVLSRGLADDVLLPEEIAPRLTRMVRNAEEQRA